jgi:6-phospho-3-hexuloisomerase
MQNAVRIVSEISSVIGKIQSTEIEKAISLIDGTEGRIFCAGAGRSGLVIKAFAMRLMHLGKNVCVVGDITSPAFRDGDVLIVLSGSGSTGSLISYAHKAKAFGGRIILFTIDKNSPIAKEADIVIEISAPSPKALEGGRGTSAQPMGSLFEQSAFIVLDAIIMEIMQGGGNKAIEMFSRHANLE